MAQGNRLLPVTEHELTSCSLLSCQAEGPAHEVACMELRLNISRRLPYFPKNPPEVRAFPVPGWKDPALRLGEGITLPPSPELAGLQYCPAIMLQHWGYVAAAV